MTEMLIDYLTFSLKPDKLSEVKRDVDLSFIIKFLKLENQFGNFKNVGGRNGYPICYEYNDVLLHVPAPEHYERMGYCIMMKGNGLRWYASLFQSFRPSSFLTDLIRLADTGLSLNISRIDIAMDDKDGILNLNEIIRKAFAREYVSQARNKNVIKENISYKGDEMTGRTIYFGSRNSSTYIRIYDKAAEQGVAGHWIRVEFEFKQEPAMRIVNSIALLGAQFPAYFPQVVNSSLRFIELDDSNRSRCSVSAFWSRFLGTVKRAKLSIQDYARKNVTRLLHYMLESYAPSIYTLMQVFPKDFLIDLFLRNGEHRLKRKHYDMIDNPDIYDTKYSSSERWKLQVPTSAMGQLAMAL